MEYKIGSDNTAAKMVSARLVDAISIAESEIAANEWAAGLAADARKAREGKVKGPKLYVPFFSMPPKFLHSFVTFGWETRTMQGWFRFRAAASW